MSENPFAVGDYGLSDTVDQKDPREDPLKREVIQLLVETRPWVRLIGVLTLIGAILLTLVGGGAILFGLFAMARGNGGVFTLLGFAYLGAALLYLYPALCLNRYASAISSAETTRSNTDLVEAVLQQRKFWRFCGVLIMVTFAASAFLGFVAGLVGGAR